MRFDNTRSINTLHDVLSLLGQGERLVVCASNDVLREILFSAVSSGTPLVNLALNAQLGASPSLKSALGTVRRAIRQESSRRQRIMVLRVATDWGSWVTRRRQRDEFLERAHAELRRAGIRTVWFVSKSMLDDRELSLLKDTSDLFLNVSVVGGLYVAQCIGARSVADQELFLPRLVTVEAGTIRLHAPTLTVQPHAGSGIEQKYRQAFETAQDGMLFFNMEGTYREPNKRMCDILGCTRDEIEQRSFPQVFPEQSRRTVLRSLLLLRKRTKAAFECDILRKSGRTIRAAITITSLQNGIYFAVVRDVTDGKRSEDVRRQCEQDYRQLVELAPSPTAVFSVQRLVLANRAFRTLFPWLKPEQAVPLSALLGKHNPAATKSLRALLEGNPGSQDQWSGAATIVGPADARIEVDISAARVMFDGRKAVLCAFSNTTARTQTLRSISEAEEKYRTVVDHSSDAISLVQDDRFVFVNRGFLRMFAYDKPEEVVGKETTTIAAARDRKVVVDRIRELRNGSDTPVRFEYLGRRNDGSTVPIEAFATTVTVGSTRAHLVYHRDVSAHREATTDLRRKVESLEIVARISAAVGRSLDVRDIQQAGLQGAMKGFGFEAGAVYQLSSDGTSLSIAVHEGLSERLLDVLGTQSLQEGITGYIAKTMEPAVLSIAEYPPYLPYKSLFEAEGFRTVTYVPLAAAGSIAAILFLGTTRHRALTDHELVSLASAGDEFGSALANALKHAGLKAIETLYRNVVENIPGVLYTALPTGTLQFISPTIQGLLGYTAPELQTNPDLWRNLVHVDDRLQFSQRISGHSGQQDEVRVQYRMLPKGKATYRLVRDVLRYQRDAQGLVVGIHGMLTDVTDSDIQGGSTVTDVLESVQEGVVLFDEHLSITSWNKSMEAMTGLSRSEVVGKTVDESWNVLGSGVASMLRSALQGEAVSSDDVVLATRGKDEGIHTWARYAPLRSQAGEIRGVVGIITDVTNRRRLEREVRESEETLRKVIDSMGDALMISDLQGRVWEVNREFTNITGYPRGEVLGLNFPYPWVVEEEMAKFVLWISELRSKNYLRDFDMTWRRKDGKEIAISLNTTLLRNAYGDPVAMLNIGRNISERKRLSEELERRNREIELLNRIIGKANTTIEFREIFDTLAHEVFQLFQCDEVSVGLLSEDGRSLVTYASAADGVAPPDGSVLPIGKSVSKLAVESGKAVVVNDLQAHESLGSETLSVQEGFHSQISIPFYLQGKMLGTFNIASRMKHAFSGAELRVLQPIADQIGAIIDRSRLFQKVSEDSKYIHNLLNSIESVVFTVDQSYRITEVNHAWHEFAMLQGMGEFAEEGAVLGRNLAEIHPERYVGEAHGEVLARLFRREQHFHSHEFEIERDGETRIYHTVISPMVIDDRVTGLVFTSTDITALKRTEAEIKRRNMELVSLNTISTSISQSLNLDDVLRVATAQIREILRPQMILFYLSRPNGQLALAHYAGIPEPLASRIAVLNAATSATGTVIKDQRPLHINRDVIRDERISPEGRAVFEELGISSLAIVPLRAKESVLGALDVAFSEEHAFNEQEQQLLLLIGSQLGAAIENAQLYAEVQSQVQRITSLYELGKGLTGALDLNTLLQVVNLQTKQSIPVDAFAYYRFNPADRLLHLMFDGNPELNAHPRVMECDDGSPMNGVVARGESFIGTLADHPGVTSMMAVPVRSKETVDGVLVLVRYAADAYTAEHLRLLESIANLTAIGIDKVMLHEDAIRKSREIENRNRELDDFTYVVSHDLKEPLISIEGYSKILLKDHRDQISAEGHEYMSSIIESTARMKSLIDDLLTLSRVGRVAGTQEVIPMATVIQDILMEMQFTLKQRNATVRVAPDLPLVRYNRTQLGMVFRNLIANAVKFNTRESPVISIAVAEHKKEYVVSVQDNGIGIDREYFERVFMIFQRLQRSEEYQGTGAGLTIVKKIVENHNGRIWVESTPGEGSTFSFSIPR